jgi:hypothetical protein
MIVGYICHRHHLNLPRVAASDLAVKSRRSSPGKTARGNTGMDDGEEPDLTIRLLEDELDDQTFGA